MWLSQQRGKAGTIAEGAKLHLLHGSGLHSSSRSSIDFVNLEDDQGRTAEHAIIPIGQHVAFYRMDDGKMKFLARVCT